eukprot:2470018-Rhodomonas_salina.3
MKKTHSSPALTDLDPPHHLQPPSFHRAPEQPPRLLFKLLLLHSVQADQPLEVLNIPGLDQRKRCFKSIWNQGGVDEELHVRPVEQLPAQKRRTAFGVCRAALGREERSRALPVMICERLADAIHNLGNTSRESRRKLLGFQGAVGRGPASTRCPPACCLGSAEPAAQRCRHAR